MTAQEQCAFCSEPKVAAIGGVPVGRVHLQRALAIARSAGVPITTCGVCGGPLPRKARAYCSRRCVSRVFRRTRKAVAA